MTCREKLKLEHPELNIYVPATGCPSRYGYLPDPDTCCGGTSCDACWDREIPDTEPTHNTTPQEDVVNHPNHYTNGGMECIEEMILVFGKETVAHFCLCNAWKYRYRALYKNGEEDMKKSHWYMNKYRSLVEEWGGETNCRKSGGQ